MSNMVKPEFKLGDRVSIYIDGRFAKRGYIARFDNAGRSFIVGKDRRLCMLVNDCINCSRISCGQWWFNHRLKND